MIIYTVNKSIEGADTPPVLFYAEIDLYTNRRIHEASG